MTSTQVEAASSTRRREASTTALLAAAGLTLLIVRVAILGSPSAGAFLAATYLVVGAVFVAVPVAAGEQRLLGTATVVAIGIGAMALASLMAPARLSAAPGAEALALNSLAAVSEEAFFRRFLYGKLLRYGPVAAIGISALLFAAVHVPAYGIAVFWVDLGAGLLLSWQRWASGSWAAPAATHVAANMLAVIR